MMSIRTKRSDTVQPSEDCNCLSKCDEASLTRYARETAQGALTRQVRWYALPANTVLPREMHKLSMKCLIVFQ